MKAATAIICALRKGPQTVAQLSGQIKQKDVKRRIKDLRDSGYVIVTIWIDNPCADKLARGYTYFLMSEPTYDQKIS